MTKTVGERLEALEVNQKHILGDVGDLKGEFKDVKKALYTAAVSVAISAIGFAITMAVVF